MWLVKLISQLVIVTISLLQNNKWFNQLRQMIRSIGIATNINYNK